MIVDKLRYRTDNPQDDHPGLGESDALKPLDKTRIRAQLTFLDQNSITDRERAVHILLSRILDYYSVAGYVGPEMSKYSELGCVLGEWIIERGYQPWREKVVLTNNYAWANPEKIFKRARFLCFQSALRLAAWEVTTVVPESEEAIKRAYWCAYSSLTQMTPRWPMIRNRYGSKRMKVILETRIREISQMQLVAGGAAWLGSFKSVNDKREAA